MKKTVLIVDDSITNLYLLKSLLEAEGLNVIEAENGQVALDKAHAHLPDLIVSDILMPVMDGYALCRRCKTDPQLQNIPFLFYTATYTEPKDEKFALDLGAERFILKPQEPDILMNIIEEMLAENYTPRQAAAKPLGEEMEYFRQYNEILFNKLEKKMSDLEMAHQKLKTREECYRLTFENASDVILTIDNNLSVLSISPSVERILGYKPRDFIGRSIADLREIFVPESFEQVIANISLVFEGKQIPETTYEFVAKDGTRKFCEINTSLLARNGQVGGLVSVARDITERKRVEEALTKSEIKYRGILESMDDAYYELDLKGNFVFFNEALISKTGYSREELMGMNYREYISPESCKHVSSVFWEIFKTGRLVRNFDYKIIRKDGQRRYLESWANILLDDDSRPIGFRGMARDITRRKQAEDAVRLNEARLESLLRIAQYKPKSIQDLLDFVLDEAVQLTGSKIGYIYFYDDEKKEFLLNSWSKNVMKECTINEPQTIYELEKTGIWGEAVRQAKPILLNDFQAPHPLKKGYPEGHAPLYRYLTIPVFKDGRIIAVTGVANKETDYDESDVRQLTLLMDSVWRITEQKKSEEALIKAEAKYRGIFENAQEGMFQSTPEGKFVTVNQALATLYGYDSPDDVLASVTDIAKQHYVDPEDRTRLLNIVNERGGVRGYEQQLHKKDGTLLWTSTNMHAIRNADGSVLYYEGFFEDITSRKQSSEKMRTALRAIVQAIALAVETRDPYTAGHQRRVADLARSIATEMKFAADQIDGIRLAATIHDLGKISVPAEILSKPTRLTEIEFSLIKVHAQAGYNILRDIEFPWPIARIVLEHHERMDGSGYPNGLTGEKLLIESRILAVADTVEAMASHRPYRPGLGLDIALDEITRNKGIHYDPEAVDACLRLFHEKGYKLT